VHRVVTNEQVVARLQMLTDITRKDYVNVKTKAEDRNSWQKRSS